MGEGGAGLASALSKVESRDFRGVGAAAFGLLVADFRVEALGLEAGLGVPALVIEDLGGGVEDWGAAVEAPGVEAFGLGVEAVFGVLVVWGSKTWVGKLPAGLPKHPEHLPHCQALGLGPKTKPHQ